jgi:translation initiation factor IF-3
MAMFFATIQTTNTTTTNGALTTSVVGTNNSTKNSSGKSFLSSSVRRHHQQHHRRRHDQEARLQTTRTRAHRHHHTSARSETGGETDVAVGSCCLEIERMKITSSSSSSSRLMEVGKEGEEINDESIPRREMRTEDTTRGGRRGQLQVVHAMGRGGRGRGGRGRGGGRGRRSGGGRGRKGPWRNPNQGPLRNEQLLDFEELRVLGPEKEMLGVMSTEEALEKGEELGLDLVIVSPEADPPVAKFMDYSKYKYEKEKKDREKKRQAKLTQVELKEVKMRYNIDTHDYDVRLRSSQKFLSNGDKVKVICQFRGRENDFRHIGREMFDRFMEDIEEYGTLEKQPGMEGNAMTMYIVPRVTKEQVNKKYEQEKKMKNKRDRAEEEEEEEEYEEEYEEEEVEV